MLVGKQQVQKIFSDNFNISSIFTFPFVTQQTYKIYKLLNKPTKITYKAFLVIDLWAEQYQFPKNFTFTNQFNATLLVSLIT